MVSMFNNCRCLDSVDMSSFNMQAVTSIASLFGSCYSLTTISISDGLTHTAFDKTWTASPSMLSSVTITGWVATTNDNGAMVNIPSFMSMPVSFNLSGSKGLTRSSLLTVINAIPTVSTTQTLTLGTDNKSKLTAEEIAIAENKGWTVA